MSYSLYDKAGVLQRKAAFAKSTTFCVVMQNIGSKFFHTIRRVSIIANNSLSSTSEENTSPILGVSMGIRPM